MNGRNRSSASAAHRRWVVLAVLGLTAAAGAIGYSVRGARAEGAPTTDPLYFAGTLTEAGTPVDGPHDITVALYREATGGSSECSWTEPAVPVVQGRFRVNLRDPACAVAVAQYPDLWVQVLVGDVPLPRARLGAVPYALESGRAVAAGGQLNARIADLEARLAAVEDDAAQALPKIWARFQARTTGVTVLGSHNVVAVTRVGVGQYRVRWTTPFRSATSYAAAAWANRLTYMNTNETLSVLVVVTDEAGTPTDGDVDVMFVAVGEQ